MKFSRARGSTSNIIVVFLEDTTSTTGGGKTGLSNTSTINISVRRELSSATTNYVGNTTVQTIATLGTFAAPSASNCRFKEIDATNQPGMYEIQFLDAIFDTSDTSRFLSGMVTGTGVAPCPFEIELTASNNQDGIHFGLTALPNTACTTNASLLTSGTSTDQLSVSAGKVLLQATQSGVTIPTVTTVTNQLTAAQIATGIWQDTTAGDFTTASSIGKSLYTSGAIPGAAGGLFIAGSNAATTANITGNITGNLSGSVGSVTAGVTVTTNNDKTGYTLVVTPPTAADIATAVWTDTTGSDFATTSSPGKILVTQLGGTFTTTSSSYFQGQQCDGVVRLSFQRLHLPMHLRAVRPQQPHRTQQPFGRICLLALISVRLVQLELC